MAGGTSSRMKQSLLKHSLDQTTRDIAQKNHKCLIPLGEKKRPLLYYHLQQAKSIGITKVFIITPEENKGFIDFLAQEQIQNAFASFPIELIPQQIPEGAEKPLGTADAVQQALEFSAELKANAFVVMNGDNIYSAKSLNALFAVPPHQNALIGYDRDGLDFPAARIQKFAVLNVNEHFYLTDIIEKPTAAVVEKAKDKNGKLRVSMNIFKLHGPSIYPFLTNCPLHPVRKEKELPTAVQRYIQLNPTGFLLLPFCEHVPDLTAADDIERLTQQL